MRRRTLLFALGVGAVAAPLTSFAQQPSKLPRIGWLVPGSRTTQDNLEEYRRAMRELGYIEGRTVETEYVYADGQFDRLLALAATLVAHNVDLIVTAGTPGCLAAKQATATIPIVFAVSSDPLGTGVVASLARPGGNITGLSLMATDLSAKRFELLHMLLPRVKRAAVLWHSANPGMALRVREAQVAAEQLKIEFFDAGARDLESLEASFAMLAERRPDALLVTTEAFTNRHRDRIVDFAMRHRIPAMYEEERFVRAGGLISYGPSVAKMFGRVATYVDKILKGTKPADLPVEQPSTFDLVINAATAKALGLNIPPALLAQADEVID
jgi:putative tryptophan/tyrosine transport system substrate-binding protein